MRNGGVRLHGLRVLRLRLTRVRRICIDLYISLICPSMHNLCTYYTLYFLSLQHRTHAQSMSTQSMPTPFIYASRILFIFRVSSDVSPARTSRAANPVRALRALRTTRC